jgi:hypothetical protein
MMSGAMFLANKTGMAPGGPPPRDITENLERKLGVRDRLPEPAFEASWAMLHFAYGTVSGVPCTLTQKVLDRDRPFLIGTLFGVLLWAVGYCGWLPAFGLYPPPPRLPKRKVGLELIATHLIYGTATALADRVLRVSPSCKGIHYSSGVSAGVIKYWGCGPVSLQSSPLRGRRV